MAVKPRWLLVLILGGSLLALTPLAYASLPDPCWVKGVFDDADFDDVVVSITSGVSIVDSQALWDVKPLQVVVASAAQNDEEPPPAQALSSGHIRAPPAS